MKRRETSPRPSVRRRAVLSGLGAGVLAAAGAGTIGTVSAQSGVTTLDLRESGDLALPVVDEQLVFAHGWGGSSVGPDQAVSLADVLAGGGYEPDEVVALVYQADAAAPEDAFVQAEEAVAEFAPIVEAAIDAGTGSIRLAGHSLGGRVVLGTLSNLADGYLVDTVAPMGAAAVGSTVTEGGRWYEGVGNNARSVRNYHSLNDDVIKGDFGPDSQFGSEGDTALGAQGAPDPSATPDTYTDVDVTDSVSGHGGYTSSAALGQDLAEAIAQMDDGETTPCEGVDAAAGPTVGGQTVCDLDGDGVYEDVNGNGRLDSDDVVTYFDNMDGDAIQSDVGAFDYNRNGRIDFDDVVILFETL